MKRLSMKIILAAACISAAAQNSAAALLKRVEGKRLSFDFTLTTADKVPVKHNGSVLIDGSCYHVEDNGMDIWCDGRTKWTVDNAAKEVYVEDPGGEADILASPSTLLGNVSNLIAGETSVSGKYTGDGPGKGSTFVLTSIKTSEPKGNADEFSFNTLSLKSPWVITDLR